MGGGTGSSGEATSAGSADLIVTPPLMAADGAGPAPSSAAAALEARPSGRQEDSVGEDHGPPLASEGRLWVSDASGGVSQGVRKASAPRATHGGEGVAGAEREEARVSMCPRSSCGATPAKTRSRNSGIAALRPETWDAQTYPEQRLDRAHGGRRRARVHRTHIRGRRRTLTLRDAVDTGVIIH